MTRSILPLLYKVHLKHPRSMVSTTSSHGVSHSTPVASIRWEPQDFACPVKTLSQKKPSLQAISHLPALIPVACKQYFLCPSASVYVHRHLIYFTQLSPLKDASSTRAGFCYVFGLFCPAAFPGTQEVLINIRLMNEYGQPFSF